MNFQERLKKAIQIKGYKIEELAEKSGTTKNSILLWKSGKVDPSFFNMMCVAKALDVSLDWLAWGNTQTKEYEILTTAIRTYGEEAQERLAIEECSELIQAICHKHRGRENNIAEEIADVEIMLEQLKIINNCGDIVAKIRNKKIDRLYQRVFDMCL